MENSFRNKNVLVIVFEILIIILGIVGITFATSRIINDRTKTEIIAGEYNVSYIGDKEISFSEIEPMYDEDINIDTVENVIRVEFSLRGVAENRNDELIYDVMLSNMNIDCSLLNEYTKWNLYKNGNLISNGSLSPSFDANVLGETMRLTNIQEDLPKYNEEYDNYVLIFWISESCDDLTTCKRVDQSNILGSKMEMEIFIALYGGAKKRFERVPNYDDSCANKPVLYDNMIAVNYVDGKWVVADSSNSNKDNLWYDYGNQLWANSLVVKDSKKYNTVGMEIDNSDVLAYYVWIPRFRYKLWNALEDVDDSYLAYDNGIDIIFENGLNNVSVNEYENDVYITHPAFSTDKTGFWISKYEISKNNDRYLSVPNVDGYRNDTLDNYKSIGDMIASDYNLGSDVSSHMVDNLEWGATLYLSHSKYGVCISDGCYRIEVNDSYVSGNNKRDTTTRNVYGVYDMAGGASEYVLGNYRIGSATYEVVLEDGDTWYQGHAFLSNRDYIIRGGVGRGLFYFGDIGMGSSEIGTRSVLVSK